MSNLTNQLFRGTIWSLVDRFGFILITLVANIWLARLLSPTEFGQIGVIMFFISLANVLTESGLGGALVRKKDATVIDYSTVFIVNLLFSIFCYLVLIAVSGGIADYYNDNSLKILLIASGLVLIINAFRFTQNARLISQLRFKERAKYKLVSTLVASLVAIILAYNGFGVWSLVALQLSTSLIDTILLWFFEEFYLKCKFSKSSFIELYGFGINTTLASLLNTGFNNLYQIILAKYFSLAQTGFYYQAKRLQDVPGSVITSLSEGVIFSFLAKLQDDKPTFLQAYNKIAVYVLTILGLTTVCTFLYAEAIVLLFYGEEWLGTVFYIQLLTIASFFYVQENVNRVIFKVFNKTRQILYLEVFKKLIQLLSVFIGVGLLNLEILLIGFVFSNVFSYLINYYVSRRILSGANSGEIVMLIKVCFICLVSIFSTTTLLTILQFEELGKLLTFPFAVIVYLLGVHTSGVINLPEEINLVRGLKKASR